MNESDARDAILLRSYETASRAQAGEVWTDSDRAWATHAAREVEGEQASADAFIARRARLGAERIVSRERQAARARRMLVWRPWIGRALIAVALAAGTASDAVGTTQHVNLLAPPLLALLAWNLAVYVVIAVRGFVRLVRRDERKPGPFAATLARWSHGAPAAHRVERLSAPLQDFVANWIRLGAPLTAARVAAVLHASAAVFAIGALASLYVRGLVLEYRAGWESTFLDASAVHALLATLLGPASNLTGIALADVPTLEALRMPGSAGENAGPWIHLYAVTVVIAVVLPRLLLAASQTLRQRRLRARFPLRLDDAYFRALSRMQSGTTATVRVAPYGFHPSPAAAEGLAGLCAQVFGPRTALDWSPVVAFGEEDEHTPAHPSSAEPDAVIALFALVSTPEPENHGAFLDALGAGAPRGVPFAVVVDESAFRRRFDATGASGAGRLEERRSAWRRLLETRQRVPVFVDLEQLEPGRSPDALRDVLDRAPRHPGH